MDNLRRFRYISRNEKIPSFYVFDCRVSDSIVWQETHFRKEETAPLRLSSLEVVKSLSWEVGKSFANIILGLAYLKT